MKWKVKKNTIIKMKILVKDKCLMSLNQKILKIYYFRLLNDTTFILILKYI